MLFSQGYEEIDKQFRLKYENLSNLNPDELLIIGSYENNADKVKNALDAGANPNTNVLGMCRKNYAENKASDFCNAIKELTLESIKYILGGTARKAIIDGNKKIIELLLSYGLDINANLYEQVGFELPKGMKKSTLIHWSTMYNRTDITKLLLEYGANPNVDSFKRDNNQYLRPITYSIINQNLEIFEALLKYGALVKDEDWISLMRIEWRPDGSPNDNSILIYASNNFINATYKHLSDGLTPLYIADDTEFKNSKINGMGLIVTKDGFYMGDIVNDIPQGTGTLRASDGYVYTGEFYDGIWLVGEMFTFDEYVAVTNQRHKEKKLIAAEKHRIEQERLSQIKAEEQSKEIEEYWLSNNDQEFDKAIAKARLQIEELRNSKNIDASNGSEKFLSGLLNFTGNVLIKVVEDLPDAYINMKVNESINRRHYNAGYKAGKGKRKKTPIKIKNEPASVCHTCYGGWLIRDY